MPFPKERESLRLSLLLLVVKRKEHPVLNKCLIKSLRFRSECRKRGIKAQLVWCVLGLVKAKLSLLGEVTIPHSIHCWDEVKCQRFETSRAVDSPGALGVVPSKIKSIITIKL